MENKTGIVICKLPKAGLGNQLFPLMRAHTFAHLNQLPVIITNYRQFKPGPWIRGERSKRNYNGFFTFQRNIIAGILHSWKLKKYKRDTMIKEPEIRHFRKEDIIGQSFYFSAIPYYTNYFDGLIENRQLVIELLWRLITPTVKQKIKKLTPPCIGVHIRMGDFRKLKQGEKFGAAGTVRTPEKYFIEIIQSIRKIHGSDLSVSIFTDGSKSEFGELFKLNNIHLIEGNNDLADLMLLSNSKIIVTSAGSTFSYWAGFISDALIIMHPIYVDMIIRSENVNRQFYYGAFDSENEQLKRQIQLLPN